jgi:predicted Zn-dependent protease
VLADLLLKKGEPAAEALGPARRAILLEPSQPAHRLVFATALARSGDPGAARRECEATLAQEVEAGLKKKLEQLLGSLPAGGGGSPAAAPPGP